MVCKHQWSGSMPKTERKTGAASWCSFHLCRFWSFVSSTLTELSLLRTSSGPSSTRPSSIPRRRKTRPSLDAVVSIAWVCGLNMSIRATKPPVKSGWNGKSHKIIEAHSCCRSCVSWFCWLVVLFSVISIVHHNLGHWHPSTSIIQVEWSSFWRILAVHFWGLSQWLLRLPCEL